jgi:hypothetical protein
MPTARIPILALATAAIMTISVMALVWPSRDAYSSLSKSPQDDAVNVFMALGTSTQRQSGGPVETDRPTTECVPCRGRSMEPIAGNVPSRPPPHPIDGEYERIAGRSRQFHLPEEAGSAVLNRHQPVRGWVMVLTGLPIKQTNCYLEIAEGRLQFSRFSGAIHFEQVTCDLNGPVPAQLTAEGLNAVEAIRTLVQVSCTLPDTCGLHQHIGNWTVVSATLNNVYLVPTASHWDLDHQDDIRLRLSPDGYLLQIEHVRANGEGSDLAASRVVWFPEYSGQ